MKKSILFVASCLCILLLGVAASIGSPPEKAAQTASKPAAASDPQATARKIVHDSVQVKENEHVLIVGDPTKIPLMEAVAVEVAKAGAFPHLVLNSPEVEKRILTEAPLNYLGTANPMTIAEFKHTDVLIALSPVDDPTTLAKVPEERVALARKAGQAVTDTIYTRPMRTVALGNPAIPTAAIARFYGVPLPQMEARFWEAVNAPHMAIEESGNKVKQALASGREVRIKSQAGTDLTLRLLPERKVMMSDGQIHNAPVDRPEQVWLPAGEVFTAPDAASVNGIVVAPLVDYRGIKIKNLRLTFEKGRVTKIEAAQNAEALKEALAKSSGDKDLFSFIDIGVNPHSRTIPNSDYCTFEMAGMVTIGIGQAPWADSPNKSEFGQDVSVPRATVEVDGKAIIKEGKLAI